MVFLTRCIEIRLLQYHLLIYLLIHTTISETHSAKPHLLLATLELTTAKDVSR